MKQMERATVVLAGQQSRGDGQTQSGNHVTLDDVLAVGEGASLVNLGTLVSPAAVTVMCSLPSTPQLSAYKAL